MTRLRASFVQRVLHLADRGFASAFFGDLGVLRAPRRGDLPDESEVAALQLTLGALLGRQRGRATAATTAARWCRGALRARSGRTTWSATNRGRDRRTGGRAQRLQSVLEIRDLAMHVADVPIQLRRRHAAVFDETLQNVLRLSR